jgi:protein-disulfide isomerase
VRPKRLLLWIAFVIVLSAGLYAVYEIITIKRYYHALHTSPQSFTVLNEGNKTTLTIVEFTNYDCPPCKDVHLVVRDYASKVPGVKVVVRPVPYANDQAETAAERAMAAGLQGKFWEVDRALNEYKGPLDEKFYREIAALYDIDYARMVSEAEGETVQEAVKENARASQMVGVKNAPALLIGKTLNEVDRDLTLADLVRMVQEEYER